jgi:hypothetical protein
MARTRETISSFSAFRHFRCHLQSTCDLRNPDEIAASDKEVPTTTVMTERRILLCSLSDAVVVSPRHIGVFGHRATISDPVYNHRLRVDFPDLRHDCMRTTTAANDRITVGTRPFHHFFLRISGTCARALPSNATRINRRIQSRSAADSSSTTLSPSNRRGPVETGGADDRAGDRQSPGTGGA